MTYRREFLKLGGAAVAGAYIGDALKGGDGGDEEAEDGTEYELVQEEPVQDEFELKAANGSTYDGFKRYEIPEEAGYLEYSLDVAGERPFVDVLVMPESEFANFSENRDTDYFDELSEDHTHNAHEGGKLPDVDEDYALVVDNTTRGSTDPNGDPADVVLEYVVGRYEPVDG